MKKTIQPWAVGIVVVVILFPIAFILLALYASSSDKNMVTEDYYEKDRRYQEKIDVLRRSEALLVKPTITYDAGTAMCTVRFPDSTHWNTVTGTVRFYRSSDHRRDLERPLRLDAERRQSISVRALQRGSWRVQLSWQLQGREYFLEERMFIQQGVRNVD